MKRLLLGLALGSMAWAEPVDEALAAILEEARGSRLVLVSVQPEPASKGSTALPEEDQIQPEEEDPGTAVPS